MLFVRHTSLGPVGEIRPGKTLIPVSLNEKTSCYQIEVDDNDTTAIAAVLSLGFVRPESPLAKPAPVAPPPAVDVVVVEKEPEAKKKAPAKKKSSSKKTSKK